MKTIQFSFQDSRGREKTAKPDAYIACREPAVGNADHESNEFNFFVEVDLSNETQDEVANKMVPYRSYYRTGGFAEWIGESRAEYKTYQFRVLILFLSEERRNNTAEQMLQQSNPPLRMVWLAVFKDFIEDPLGKVWIRPLATLLANAIDPHACQSGHDHASLAAAGMVRNDGRTR